MAIDVTRRSVIALNGSFIPIGKISVERAICLLFLGKAYSVKDSGEVIKSATKEIPVPEAICVPSVRYIRQAKPHFQKRLMYERDNHSCVYCGCNHRSMLTLDHVIPRARWSEESRKRGLKYELNSFENCVTACIDCNRIKGHKLLSELGWKEIVGKVPKNEVQFDWSQLLE